MVVGEEAFVFAPAHSAAMIWKETEETKERFVSAWMYANNPCALMFKEDFNDVNTCHAVPCVPFYPKKIEALTAPKDKVVSAVLIHGVMKDTDMGAERSIQPLIGVRT